MNKILDTVGNSEFEVKVRSPDTNLLLEGFQKIANRITTGLILAADCGRSVAHASAHHVCDLRLPGICDVVFLCGGRRWFLAGLEYCFRGSKIKETAEEK